MQRLRIMFSHASVCFMVIAALFGLAVMIISAPWWAWLLIPLGFVAQMLNEYNLHRFIFHLPPPSRQWAFDLLYQAHYGHHDFPTNHKLFFVPIWIALPILFINFGLVWGAAVLFGWPAPFHIATAIVLVGGLLMFLGYEWFHMTSHLNIPKTKVERHVTTLHNQHHFRDFSKWFHVSPGGEVIDRAMKTAIDRDALKNKQRGEFMRTLGLQPDDPRLVSARSRFSSKYNLSQDEVSRAAMT